MQFSNFCNMSCIMCWDGENPPLHKMPPSTIERVAEEMAPYLTVIIPHGASEPLVVTWDETRDMAEEYSVDLGLTTNTQYLDEKKFHELEDIVELIVLSIDSHVGEVFKKIRPWSKPEKVFENLATTARLAAERRIECMAQIVFMTENAGLLPETVAYMADAGIPIVNVLQLVDFNGRCGYSDPLLHFSADYVAWTRQRCIDVAREKKICFRWLDRENHDFRENPIGAKPHRVASDMLEHWAKHALPGYCKYVYNRVRLHADGEMAPCGWATEGDLTLGNIVGQSLVQTWNGVNARDLRRAHLTADYPTLCKSCRFTDPIPPQTDMPFLPRVKSMISKDLRDVEPTMTVIEPANLARVVDAPSFRVKTPGVQIADWFLTVSLGGGVGEHGAPGADELHVSLLVPLNLDDGTTQLPVSNEAWQALRTNMGYWWAVFAVTADDPGRALRSSEIRCVIRHEAMERIAGSTLVYPDEEARPLVDLGAAKKAGWAERGPLQARPEVRGKPSGLWAGERPVSPQRPRKKLKPAAKT